MAYLLHVSCPSTTTVSQLFEPQSQKVVILRTFTCLFAPVAITQVIRCLSQCVSPKIAIFTTILFALGTPLWQSLKTLHEWKDNSVLAKPLAARTHLYSTVSQLFEPQVQKIAIFTYCSPHFCFPWRRPCNYHAICCMDGKTIQCLPNPLQHVPLWLDLQPVDTKSQWRHNWKSAQVVNSHLVCDLTIR